LILAGNTRMKSGFRDVAAANSQSKT